MSSRSQSTRAFAVRLDRACRERGKTLDDLAREAAEALGRRIRSGGLPSCGERPGWIPLTLALAEILDVNVSWLVFGEGTAVPAVPPLRLED